MLKDNIKIVIFLNAIKFVFFKEYIFKFLVDFKLLVKRLIKYSLFLVKCEKNRF